MVRRVGDGGRDAGLVVGGCVRMRGVVLHGERDVRVEDRDEPKILPEVITPGMEIAAFQH